MVIDWLLQLVQGFVGWVASLFPPVELPDWLTGMIGSVNDFLGTVDGLGGWFPWPVLATVLATLVTFYAVAFGIKLVRAILAHLPEIGGSG